MPTDDSHHDRSSALPDASAFEAEDDPFAYGPDQHRQATAHPARRQATPRRQSPPATRPPDRHEGGTPAPTAPPEPSPVSQAPTTPVTDPEPTVQDPAASSPAAAPVDAAPTEVIQRAVEPAPPTIVDPPPVPEPPSPAPAFEPMPEPLNEDRPVRVLSGVGPSGVDGIPGTYDDGTSWLRGGLRRHSDAVSFALPIAWTGIWVCLWGAAIGMILGALIAAGFASQLSGIGVGQAASALGVIAGGVIGAADGFWVVFRYLVVDHIIQAIISIASGWVIAVLLVIITATFERVLLSLRGYRRLSRDEVRRVAPLVKDAADAMGLDALPRFAMADVIIPNAWTHMRTIVLTKGVLLTLNDDELRAVLVHELEHWRQGDSVGLRCVWAAAWPITVVYDIGMALAGRAGRGHGGGAAAGATRTLLAIVGWLFAWPAWILVHWVIAPAVADSQRKYEYAADQAAARIGLGGDLIEALRKMSAFESGRTGFEQAISATHPPTELRIEALEEPKPDDAEYQEDDLRSPSWKEFRRIALGWHKPKRRDDGSSAGPQ